LLNSFKTHEDDIVLLVSAQNKRHIIQLHTGEELHTHRGIIRHDDLIGKLWGIQVQSHVGSTYILLKPSMVDFLMEIRRNTQIMYPKDIGFTMMMMGIGPGSIVVEAGTGSGALTTAMAFAVGPSGKVISYDNRQEMQQLAQKNLTKVGLADRVTFKLRDIVDGFDEEGVDSLFLDLPNPYDYLTQVQKTLKNGGFFGTILPTTNQVSRLIVALHRHQFGFTEICEILLRFYKVAADRFRPTDRMTAHTGYLIFARSFVSSEIQMENFKSESEDDLR
jgi:tRNA (adenine57-N1/adenine58-N1)-methyltransferase